jgi:plastocyanin
MVRRAIPFALLLALGTQGSAFAATRDVSISGFAFVPSAPTIALGDSVRWTNLDSTNHTSTGNSPLNSWSSPTLAHNATYTKRFTAAGKYPYHCTIHPSMTGTINLKPKVSPSSGPQGTSFTITVATITAPSGFVYDIQKKNPGGSFTNWRTGTTAVSQTFSSSGQATGTYQFRARLRKTSNGATSGWSPARSITVT